MRVEKSGGLGIISQQKRMQASMGKNNKRLSEVLEKLSTGRRINRASDDAAGLAIAERLGSQIRGFKMAGRNAQDAMSALNIADGASQEVGSMLQRQRELALQARNGTMNDSDRASLNEEYQQLGEEINRISESTTFNNQNVANGTELGDGTAEIAVAEDGSTVTLPGVDFSTGTLGSAGTDISTAAGAESAVGSLDTAFENLGTQRSSIGASSNRLESTVNSLMTAEINSTAAESVIADQDMAMGIAQLARDRLLSESSTRAFSVFNKISSDHIMGLLQ